VADALARSRYLPPLRSGITRRGLLESYERITGALLAHVSFDAARTVQPPPDLRLSDSAIRRYQGFDVEDADDHIDVPAATVAPTLPVAPVAESPPAAPLPPDGHYLRPEGEGFTLRHGRLQIEYRPAGVQPGHVSTDFVDTPPSGDGWLSLPPDHFEALRARVLAELRKVVESGGSHELPPIDPLNVEPEPAAVHETIPLAPDDSWSDDDAVSYEPEPPSPGDAGVHLRDEVVGALQEAVPEETEDVAVLPDVPVALPVAAPTDADVPLAAPVLPEPVAVAVPGPREPGHPTGLGRGRGLPSTSKARSPTGPRWTHRADHDQTGACVAAPSRGHVAVVRLLLDRGAEADRTDAPTHRLDARCRCGHVPVAAILAERGAERPDERWQAAARGRPRFHRPPAQRRCRPVPLARWLNALTAAVRAGLRRGGASPPRPRH
jgi:hypothetical protein